MLGAITGDTVGSIYEFCNTKDYDFKMFGSESAYTDDSVEVEKNAAADPDAVLDINAASALLLCGFTDAAYIPGVEIRDPKSDFFTAFPPGTAFFTDSL